VVYGLSSAGACPPHKKNCPPPGRGCGQGFFLMYRSLCAPLKLCGSLLVLARLWRRSCAYQIQIAAIPMTLSDLQSHSQTASLFKCDFSDSWTEAHMISTDSLSLLNWASCRIIKAADDDRQIHRNHKNSNINIALCIALIWWHAIKIRLFATDSLLEVCCKCQIGTLKMLDRLTDAYVRQLDVSTQ